MQLCMSSSRFSTTSSLQLKVERLQPTSAPMKDDPLAVAYSFHLHTLGRGNVAERKDAFPAHKEASLCKCVEWKIHQADKWPRFRTWKPNLVRPSHSDSFENIKRLKQMR